MIGVWTALNGCMTTPFDDNVLAGSITPVRSVDQFIAVYNISS